MALVVKDRVKETTTTTGTGTVTLAGASTGFQSFSVIGDGNTTYYTIVSGNDWEVGVGTYTASGTTLSRDTILESSNAGSAITLSGTSDVFCTYPAERSVNTADIGVSVQAYDADTAKYDDTTANFTGDLQVSGTSVATENSLGMRNLIINGNMRIAQRGTSASGITGFSYNTVDRWAAQPNSMGTWTNTQDSDVPTGQGFKNSFKLECTTADASPAATDYVRIFQRIEAQNLQHLKYGTSNAEKVTLSFWVKSNKIGTYTVRIYTEDNGRHIVNTYTISSADTWEKKTITFNADTVGTINNDNGVGFQIGWWLASGTDYTSGTTPTSWESSTVANIAAGLTVNLADSTSNYINITGVQLELGENATPYEHRMYSQELAMCQRYYEKNYDINTAPATNTSKGLEQVAGTIDGNQNFYYNIRFAVPKRANPSINFYKSDGTANTWRYDRSGASNQSGTPAVGDNGDSSFYMRIPSTGATWVVATMAGFWTASAEL